MSKSITRMPGVFSLVFIILLRGCIRLLNALVPKSGEICMADEPLKLLDDVPWEGDCHKITLESPTFWYSSDDERILYQYKDGDTIFKLTGLPMKKASRYCMGGLKADWR